MRATGSSGIGCGATKTSVDEQGEHAARILARSFYRELRSHGYTPSELVAVSTEIIELVTLELRSEREAMRTAA